MRVDDLLAAARKKLGGGQGAALDARLLLQAATGLTQAEIIADPQRVIDTVAAAKFDAFITRRAAHEPVSRILGTREFYGRAFTVTPDVLDPRADTECVVELALGLTKAGRFIDLGTGSGIIAVTLAAENKALSGVATDISTKALAVAQANAQTNGVADRLQFIQAEWLAGVDEAFDLIISNPPYIRKDASLPPDVALFDPHLALFGGEDGLACYRAIAQAAGPRLAPGGHVVVEIGLGQDVDIKAIFSSHGFVLQTSARDLSGHVRALAFHKV